MGKGLEETWDSSTSNCSGSVTRSRTLKRRSPTGNSMLTSPFFLPRGLAMLQRERNERWRSSKTRASEGVKGKYCTPYQGSVLTIKDCCHTLSAMD